MRRLRRSTAGTALALALGSVLLLPGCGGHQPPSRAPAAPAAAGVTPGTTRALEAALTKAFEQSGSPGLAVAVAARGWTWSGGRGVAAVDGHRAVTGRTPFALGGMTNTFVAALALKEAERGRLRLDDPVTRWVPAAPTPRAVTVADLLAHTSGLPEPPESLFRAIDRHPRRRYRPQQALAGVGPVGPRGTFAYAGSNYLLAGQVLERATGTSVAAALHRDLVDALGANTMALQPDERPPASSAHGHAYPEGSVVDVSDGSGWVPFTSAATIAWTAGGLVGSAEEVARFGQALGTGRLLAPSSLRRMLRFEDESSFWEGYGVGVAQASVSGYDVWGHEGQVPGFHTTFVHVPRRRLTVAVLANDEGADVPGIAAKVIDAATGAS